MRRLLKFDIVHPAAYLRKKQAEWGDALDGWTLAEYRTRLNALRSNYSDYYTAPLNATGRWLAEEYYLLDPVFTRKAAAEVVGSPRDRVRLRWRAEKYKRVYSKRQAYDMAVAELYVRRFAPDVIFVRSQPFPSLWWQRFRKTSLLVARLSARMPRRWHPEDFDLVYTDQPTFQKFFGLHGVDTRLNDQGFDARVADELTERPARYDVSFIGGLGSVNFSQRTRFLESLAHRRPFPWWGYWWPGAAPMSDYPALAHGFQGATSGLEMYQTFRDSRINLNDYVDTADGVGFNQRLFEVLGSGGFLLTRAARNFADAFPDDIFATYTDEADCLRQIAYFLEHEEERLAIARRGQAYMREHYDFSRIALGFERDISALLDAQ